MNFEPNDFHDAELRQISFVGANVVLMFEGDSHFNPMTLIARGAQYCRFEADTMQNVVSDVRAIELTKSAIADPEILERLGEAVNLVRNIVGKTLLMSRPIAGGDIVVVCEKVELIA